MKQNCPFLPSKVWMRLRKSSSKSFKPKSKENLQPLKATGRNGCSTDDLEQTNYWNTTVKTSGFSISSIGKTMKLKIKFFPEGELIEILMLEHPREGIFYSLEIE